MSRGGAPRTVFLAAGEGSGDLHGAGLARELLRRDPGLRLVGLGGSRMADAGVELLADLDRLAVMGFVEVVTRLPDLLKLRREVHRFVEREAVDLVVPIDYPGFNLSLSCHAHDLDVPVLYYIAPQVWAWHRSRARKLARCTDRVCVVLPFEKELLESYGVEARFVGHPLLDGEGGPPPAVPREGRSERRVLGLFPGSRAQEVERILPPLREAAVRLQRDDPALEVRVARAPDLAEALFPRPESWPLAAPGEIMADATAALTKSGTITLQLALAGVPMVVGYRVNPITYLLARWLVKVDHVALVNLVAGERLVPELIQGDLEPDRLVAEVRPFLRSGDERRRVVRGLAGVRGRLGEPGCAGRVADAALELMRARR